MNHIIIVISEKALKELRQIIVKKKRTHHICSVLRQESRVSLLSGTVTPHQEASFHDYFILVMMVFWNRRLPSTVIL